MNVDVPDESRLPDDVQVTPALATASTYVCSESCPSMRAEVSGYVPKPKQPARSARKSLFLKFVDKYCAPSLALASLVLVLALLLGPLRSAPTFAVKHSESKSSAPEFRIECGSCAFVPPENPATNRDQTAKMAGRGEKDVILVANDNDEFLNLISKPGSLMFIVSDRVVLEWTTNIDPAKFAGHCEPMTAIFKRFKQEFGDKFGVFRAVADSIDPLEKFRNQSCPTFLFFINRILVKVVRGANAPVIERVIREHIELESGGHAHKQIVPDDTTRPILSFLSPDAVLLDEPSASAPPALHEKIGSTTSLSNVATAAISTESSPETAEPPGDLEHTFAMLKPDSMFPSRIDEVMGLLYHHRFEIVGVKKVWLTKEQAAELYKENEKMDYFDRLVDYVSCAPVLMMRISKINAIQAWRDIVGPRDPKDARKDAPKSLRGLYGQDRLINSFHASDGPVSAARELEFAFGDSQNFISFPYESPDSPPNSSNSGLPQKTLAVIKPNAMLKVDEIIEKIVARGFSVIKREEVLLQTERAQELSLEFLETPQFEESVTFLTSGPVLLLTLKGENVIEGWLEMLGPSDPEIARQLFPMSLRAQFGVDAISNGLHGSQTVELAISQIHTFFPHFLNKAASLGSIFRTPLGSRQASKAGSKANLAPSMRASVVAIEAQREAMKAAAAAVGAAGNTIDSENTAEGVQPGATESTAAVTEEPEVLPVERTLALIKPDVYPAKKNEIIERIAAEGFTIVVEREVQFDKEKAAEFYKEHLGKGFYEELTDWMSSAPIYAMVLEKQGAVKAWRALAGPTNSEKAREDSPQSIRAQYGTDGSKNAVHGSDSTTSSAREIAVVFGAEVAPEPELQRTLALIKPDVYPAKKDEIVARIRKNGFAIVKESEVFFDKEKAAEFYKEHLGKGFYEELTTWMSSAPIYALILEKPAAVKEWRNLAGPTNSNKARESSPFSIRALYGTDGSLNAVHGSDSVASAEREIRVVFGEVTLDAPQGASPNATSSSEEPEVLPVERTLALIKPDVYPAKKNEIIERIAAEGFTIVVEREVQFDKEKAAEFYKEHLGKGFYEELTDWMSSAPIYAMVLEKQGAVKAWRALAGPTNSEKAREDSPQSIRAQYGTDGSKNAVHGSDSTTSSAREIAVVFGAEVAPEPELQRTLALIKPDVYPSKKDEIVARIRKNGFTIVKESEVCFDKEKAAEFYKEHLGKGFYEELTTWMSSAPIYALILEKPAAVKEWRNLAGPTNSNKARESSPFSIRALYGTDGSLNAVHGSDSVASAEREISVVFDMNQETSAKQVETKFSAPVSAITSKPASIIASRTASAKNMPADASPAADI